MGNYKRPKGRFFYAFSVQFSLSHKRSQTSHICDSLYAPKPLLLHRQFGDKPSLRTGGYMLKSFLFNSVRVKLVPFHGQDTCSETGIAFYVNNGNGGVIGVRVYPDGRKVQINPDRINWAHKHGKAEYLQFRNAWSKQFFILASHAVYTAWRGTPIPPGMTIDHIDGCTTNNDVRNLRCVSNLVNNRDGGFLRKLKNVSIDPGASSRQTGGAASAEKGFKIPRWMLLRYFGRMAKFKASHSATEYQRLTKNDLMHILYDNQ